MADAIATLPELEARLDWGLDAGEKKVAAAALEDLSEDARFYGSAGWLGTAAPRQVKSLVLRAAVRHMRNPDGFVQSRAGDETIQWSDIGEDSGTARFTEREQKMLATMAGRGQGLVSVGIMAYNPGPRRAPQYINPTTQDTDDSGAIYALDSNGGTPFPMHSSLDTYGSG